MTQVSLQLLNQGLILMLIGMGVVFSFLCILVFAMGVMSKIVGYLNKIFPELTNSVTKPVKRTNASDEEAIAAAIAIAYAKG